MLQSILNKSWRQYPTKQQLNSHRHPISKTIQIRQTRHARYCWRSKDELISDILLWAPSQGRASVWRPTTYLQQYCTDTGCSLEDLSKAVDDRVGWRERERVRKSVQAVWHDDIYLSLSLYIYIYIYTLIHTNKMQYKVNFYRLESYGLSFQTLRFISITAVLRQRWLWHNITHEVWYSTKKTKKLLVNFLDEFIRFEFRFFLLLDRLPNQE